VAGAGITEALTENVSIGTPVPGLVAEIFVKPGDRVKKGDPLFRLDDRDLQADLLMKQANVLAAKERLARLKQQPRPEDIPPAEAKVKEAEAALSDAKSQLALYESVVDKRAVILDELNRRTNAVGVAQARLDQATANLQLLKAGAWKSDIDVAQAELTGAEAQAKATQLLIERLVVRAPMDGQVLQVKTHVGEYANGMGAKDPLVMLGNLDELAVRVDVDENDAWRVQPGAKARAYVRGNGQLQTDLEYVRVEPYIVPKRSLTGDATERVDTRVLQVIYRFDRRKLPVYVGQQMDVFISASDGPDVQMHSTTANAGGMQ
jgi:multidrug resistance efflux pump